MKKLILIAIGFALMVSTWIPVKAQYVEPFFQDSVSNSMTKTAYLYLEQFKKTPGEKIDSVTIVTYASGEIDIDLLRTFRGIEIKDAAYEINATNTAYYTIASDDSTTMTINLDSAVTSLVNTVSRTYDDLDGANILKCIWTAASSGNDATDPNYLVGVAFVYTSTP